MKRNTALTATYRQAIGFTFIQIGISGKQQTVKRRAVKLAATDDTSCQANQEQAGVPRIETLGATDTDSEVLPRERTSKE